MTNTIPNMPRKLLERVLNAGWGSETVNALDDLRDFLESASSSANHVEDVRAMVAAPSPAGVDGLNTDRNAAFKACPESGCDWGSFYLGWKARGEVEQVIIDGLRSENEALHDQVKVLQSDANSWQSGYDEGRRMGGKHCSLTIDQQAQRIGELEGLLRAESARVDFLDAYIVTADAPDTGKVAMLADSGTLRECIDFALSSGKEGAQ